MVTGAVSRYKVVSEAENCHGAECLLRAAARVRVHRDYGLVLIAGAKAKTVTNNLPILSVLAERYLFFVFVPHLGIC